MIRLAILVGSSRPGRKAPVVAQWVFDQTRTRNDAEFDIVDLADVDLPRLDETTPALFGSYQQPHTRRWAERIDAFDGFVFVTPEYNHSFPAVIKDALDYLFAEWNDKPCGFVSYGVAGGVRAVEHLRVVVAELK